MEVRPMGETEHRMLQTIIDLRAEVEALKAERDAAFNAGIEAAMETVRKIAESHYANHGDGAGAVVVNAMYAIRALKRKGGVE